MEGLEYGYDVEPDSPLLNTHNDIAMENVSSDHHETAEERRIRKEEKRAAKLKRKEERAAKKARKDPRRLETDPDPEVSKGLALDEGKDVNVDDAMRVEGDGGDQVSASDNGVDDQNGPALTADAQGGLEDEEMVKKGEKASKKRKHQDVVVSSQDLENNAASETQPDLTSTLGDRAAEKSSKILVEETMVDHVPVAKKAKKTKRKASSSTDAHNSLNDSSMVVDISPTTPKRKTVASKKRSKEAHIGHSEMADTPEAGPSRLASSQSIIPDSSQFSQPSQPSLVQSKNPRTPRSQRNAEAKETDDELRRKFRDVGAMNNWLASQWRPYSELTRLQSLGILTYTRGKFDEDEKSSIKGHLELFKKVNRMSDDELINIIMGKGRASERGDYPKFWPEVAAVAPGRPVKAVKDYVRREYDPRGRKGAWSADEDEELLRAYEVHPNEWTKIANMVERTETDCRDRYKNQLASLSTRKTGHWTTSEETKLSRIVQEVNEQVGNDPLGYEAPWDIVSDKMGGIRSRMQCRKKWQDGLRMRELSKGGVGRFSSKHRPFLVQRLRRLDVDSEEDVDWDKIREGSWMMYTASQLRMGLKRMMRDVTNSQDMPWDGLLDELENKYPVPEDTEAENQMMKTIRSLEFIVSESGDEEEPEEEEGVLVIPSSSYQKKKPTTYSRQTPTKSKDKKGKSNGKIVSKEDMEMEEEAIVSDKRAIDLESEGGQGEGEARDEDEEVEADL